MLNTHSILAHTSIECRRQRLHRRPTRLSFKMLQYSIDRCGIFNADNDLHLPTAAFALTDVDLKHSLPVDWGSSEGQTFAVDIAVEAYDRRGLVRDVSAVLTDAKIGIQSMNTHTSHDGIADMQLRILVHDFAQLSQVIARIHALPNVLQAKRRV